MPHGSTSRRLHYVIPSMYNWTLQCEEPDNKKGTSYTGGSKTTWLFIVRTLTAVSRKDFRPSRVGEESKNFSKPRLANGGHNGRPNTPLTSRCHATFAQHSENHMNSHHARSAGSETYAADTPSKRQRAPTSGR